MIDQSEIAQLNKQFENSNPQEIISYFINKFNDRITFATSFGAEDQVITDMIASIEKPCEIFTLDTGRMFPETYNILERTRMKYNFNIKVFFPEYHAVEKMVLEHSINLFYDSVENRKLCCSIRKTEPLKRALQNKEAWICGLRKEQSVTRKDINVVEWDELHQMLKINPLINWTEEQVWDYIKIKHIPYNKLHDQGFRSIGCQPCTRAVQEGEDVRSGRWWWEDPQHKECGLHKK